MTKYTDGPWATHVRNGKTRIFVPLQAITVCWLGGHTGRCEANARMIRACPDLFEALRKLVRVTDKTYNESEVGEAMADARAAILLAEGDP